MLPEIDGVDFFKGYDYTIHGRDSLKGKFKWQFLNGLVALLRKNNLLFTEAGINYDSMDEDELSDVVEKEAESHVTNDNDQAYSFCDVENGIKPIGIVHFKFTDIILRRVLQGLTMVGFDDESYELKHSLVAKFTDDSSEKPANIKPIHELVLRDDIAQYASQLTCDSLGDLIILAITTQALVDIFAVYQECAALQSESQMEIGIIKWNIGMQASLFMEDSMKLAEYSALSYLRSIVLFGAEQRLPYNIFDIYRIEAARDNFRLTIAKLDPLFREEFTYFITSAYEGEELEGCDFAKYYQRLSQPNKVKQDKNEKEILAKVKEKYSNILLPPSSVLGLRNDGTRLLWANQYFAQRFTNQ
jgi:hypothetical protein